MGQMARPLTPVSGMRKLQTSCCPFGPRLSGAAAQSSLAIRADKNEFVVEKCLSDMGGGRYNR